MVICLVNQKGGVGKTTLAVNLAGALPAAKGRVLLVDADPQGSVLQWQSVAGYRGFEVVHQPDGGVARTVSQAARKHPHVVVDLPPGVGKIPRAVLGVARLAVVPIGPSALDIWSSRETIEMIQEVRRRNRRLQAKLLVSRKIPRTRVGREGRDAVEPYGMGVFKSEISQRVAFVEAMIAGKTVLDYAPTSMAAREIRALCGEILS
jgi:chromosome partitioning protein